MGRFRPGHGGVAQGNIQMSEKFSIAKPGVRSFITVCLFFLIAGCVFRLWHITQSDFVFYDEGFYLNHNRALGEMIAAHQPMDMANLKRAFEIYARTCLASGKSLWFFLADARIFFGRVHEWFWARVMAALFGILTIFLTYGFAARFFRCRWTAWLSAVVLSVLPSHVFYSRLGMQEALSTFLVLLGFYFYLFPRRFSFRTFAAGFIFGLAFFSNYRLIMLPALILSAEYWMSRTERRGFDWRKWIWVNITFAVMAFGVGGVLFGGINTFIIFAWVFHQQNLASAQFHWLNVLSYPYYVIRLEHWTFAVLLFSGVVSLIRHRHRREWLPLVLAMIQMLIFSLPEEKGARYLCVMYPFMAMSVAYTAVRVFRYLRNPRHRVVWGAVIVGMLMMLTRVSSQMAMIGSDYRTCAGFLTARNPGVKFLSTQKYVQDLFVSDRDQVRDVPRRFSRLVEEFSNGYEYLVLGPQAYMSLTPGARRFALKLDGPYEMLLQRIEPLKTYDHFDRVMLERFVLEHSSNLLDSTEFLRHAQAKGFGRLRVYDLKFCVPLMMEAAARYQQRTGGAND